MVLYMGPASHLMGRCFCRLQRTHQVSPCVEGHWGSQFCGLGPFLPQFFGVLDLEARFWGFYSTAVCSFSPYRRWFTVCRCCSRFFGSFVTHTLHAALEHYTDIVVSIFNDFEHGFVDFGAFCCSFVVSAPPQCPLCVATLQHEVLS